MDSLDSPGKELQYVLFLIAKADSGSLEACLTGQARRLEILR